MYTTTSGLNDDTEGYKITVHKLYYHHYIWDDIWAWEDQLRDNTHPLRDIVSYHIKYFTVSIQYHWFYTTTGRMSVTLPLNENT